VGYHGKFKVYFMNFKVSLVMNYINWFYYETIFDNIFNFIIIGSELLFIMK